MNYKNLRDHADRTEMRDNDSGHFTQVCPLCKSVQFQIDARNNKGRCHNVKCRIYHRWLSINEIDSLIRKYL